MSFSDTAAPYSLASVRRIVTGHTSDGKAIIIRDEQLVPSGTAPGVESSRVTRLWTTKESPADNISGEITTTLEDGVECTLSEPGSILVQRGTLHGWENRGSSWARFIGVVVDAKPVQIVDEGKTITLKEGPA
ncbi:hypothetical protein BS47DRAFT_1379095 [Hydnum rufescens UP504]|uniref:Uncharacterized protein n=1 Tax=Hydnum rufescens UP504 TaxID=1448309 RepID=A0A9P6B9B2_9AGAM|nr:hypothetical protein BS47DRAFT_1379095 [Hydnum rufescens UP504]